MTEVFPVVLNNSNELYIFSARTAAEFDQTTVRVRVRVRVTVEVRVRVRARVQIRVRTLTLTLTLTPTLKLILTLVLSFSACAELVWRYRLGSHTNRQPEFDPWIVPVFKTNI